jgi:hypothetical protein
VVESTAGAAIRAGCPRPFQGAASATGGHGRATCECDACSATARQVRGDYRARVPKVHEKAHQFEDGLLQGLSARVRVLRLPSRENERRRRPLATDSAAPRHRSHSSCPRHAPWHRRTRWTDTCRTAGARRTRRTARVPPVHLSDLSHFGCRTWWHLPHRSHLRALVAAVIPAAQSHPGRASEQAFCFFDPVCGMCVFKRLDSPGTGDSAILKTGQFPSNSACRCRVPARHIAC